MKKYGIAVILSALLPGAGQLYNRHWLKGILFMLASLILADVLRRNIPMSAFSAGHPLAHTGVFFPLAFILLGISVWSIVDAYRQAKRKPS